MKSNAERSLAQKRLCLRARQVGRLAVSWRLLAAGKKASLLSGVAPQRLIQRQPIGHQLGEPGAAGRRRAVWTVYSCAGRHRPAPCGTPPRPEKNAKFAETVLLPSPGRAETQPRTLTSRRPSRVRVETDAQPADGFGVWREWRQHGLAHRRRGDDLPSPVATSAGLRSRHARAFSAGNMPQAGQAEAAANLGRRPQPFVQRFPQQRDRETHRKPKKTAPASTIIALGQLLRSGTEARVTTCTSEIGNDWSWTARV